MIWLLTFSIHASHPTLPLDPEVLGTNLSFSNMGSPLTTETLACAVPSVLGITSSSVSRLSSDVFSETTGPTTVLPQAILYKVTWLIPPELSTETALTPHRTKPQEGDSHGPSPRAGHSRPVGV